MEEMPLVYVKRGKVIEGKSRINAVDRLKEIRKEGKKAYVLDLDGIKRNSPNLAIYRKLAHKPFLWIDALPRCLEDVMDLVVVGAERITIGDVVSDAELKKIREMCDVGLFLRGDDGDRGSTCPQDPGPLYRCRTRQRIRAIPAEGETPPKRPEDPGIRQRGVSGAGRDRR